jgi:type VI protein secretion system component Hcp
MPDEHLLDGYLKLVKKDSGFVQGEAQDAKYSGHIALSSFEFGGGEFKDEEDREDAQADIEDDFSGDSSVSGSLVAKRRAAVTNSKRDELKVRKQEGCTFTIDKTMDLSSPILFQAYCSSLDGDPNKRIEFAMAQVFLRKSTGAASRDSGLYLTMQFNSVSITDYSLDINGGSPAKESITFSYGGCRMSYSQQKADGTLGNPTRQGWDFLSKPPGIL